MTSFARRAIGRYWRWQLALGLVVGTIGFIVQPGGPTGSTFAIVLCVADFAAAFSIAICGQRADKRERSR